MTKENGRDDKGYPAYSERFFLLKFYGENFNNPIIYCKFAAISLIRQYICYEEFSCW
jgi:hypothetical protein